MNNKQKVGIGVGIAIAGFFIIAVAGYSTLRQDSNLSEEGVRQEKHEFSNLSEEELQSISVQWDFEDVLRNVEKYNGYVVHFRGKIITTDDIPDFKDRYALQVQIRCKPWPDNVDCDNFIVDYTGNRLLPDDEVEVWGQVKGITEMKMLVFGNEKLTPVVTGLKVKCTSC